MGRSGEEGVTADLRHWFVSLSLYVLYPISPPDRLYMETANENKSDSINGGKGYLRAACVSISAIINLTKPK